MHGEELWPVGDEKDGVAERELPKETREGEKEILVSSQYWSLNV